MLNIEIVGNKAYIEVSTFVRSTLLRHATEYMNDYTHEFSDNYISVDALKLSNSNFRFEIHHSYVVKTIEIALSKFSKGTIIFYSFKSN